MKLPNFLQAFWDQYQSVDTKSGIHLLILREILWVILTALTVNIRFEETDDVNDQTWVHLSMCAVFLIAINMLYAGYEVVSSKNEMNSYGEMAGLAIERIHERKIIPYTMGMLVPIPAFNWSGYLFANFLIDKGWDADIANIFMASLATGYFEQAAQYIAITMTDKVIEAWRDYSSAYHLVDVEEKRSSLLTFAGSLMEFVKIVVNGFLSVRMLGSWYPGAIWNLAFMGLTIKLGMEEPDIPSVAYWLKLLLLVVPSVTLGVATASVGMAMAREKLDEADAAVADGFGRFFKYISGGKCYSKSKAYDVTVHTSKLAIHDALSA